MELRQYQKDALNNIIRSHRRGNKNVLLQAATGSGKTVMASAFVRYSVDQGKRVLFLAHRRELINQCSEKLSAFGIHHGIIMAGEMPQLGQRVQVASVDTLRARSITSKKEELPRADIVIIDEAHRCLSNTYLKLVSLYKDSMILGLTATPVRSDGRGLGHIFEDMVQAPSIKELTQFGSLVPATYYAPTIPDLKGIQSYMGDFNSSQLSDRMNKPKLVGDIISSWKSIAKGKKTIVFASSVSHSMNLAESFQDMGVIAEHIDGGTDNDDRERILNDFNNGPVQVVCNCMVLTEGFDCPPAEVCVLARPTKSLGMYLQMVGRVLRPNENKDKSIVIDHSGAVYMHGFIEDEIEWRLDPMKPISLNERKEEREKEATQVTCEGCFTVYEGSNICPKCGHIAEKKSSYVEVLDAELGLVGRKTRKVKEKLSYAPEFRREFYAMLLGYCEMKQYNHGWASHKYKTRFKEFPKHYKVEPIKPNKECLNYIRHLNIKSAKSKKQGVKR